MNHAVATPPCPIDSLREQALTTLEKHCAMIVSAPPGTGKSSRIPLWFLQNSCLDGKKILVLEPRRMAARALGRYMASLLDEQPGQTVGWRVRGESVGKNSRVLVVTEGVLLRILQTDPALEQTGCIIFDEFHERSLQADLGLALCLESQAALRPDLRIVLMSATLDIGRTRTLLGACPALVCEAPAWPVDIRWLPVPGPDRDCGLPLLKHVAATIRHALLHEEGNILVFLPGMGEMLTVSHLLENALPSDTTLHILHSSLPFAEQDRAIAPTNAGERKIVLATTIAESSLTIDGIRIVIDCGFTRISRHDQASGIDRLVALRLTQDSAKQRTGRAGRTQSGICYRLWAKEDENGMLTQARAAIVHADLSGLVLLLADWGIVGNSAIRGLTWTDAPPEGALTKATSILHMLGALGSLGRITPLGRQMAHLPVEPRLARLLIEGKQRKQIPIAACMAALLEADSAQNVGDLHTQLAWLCRKDSNPEKQRIRNNARLFASSLEYAGDVFAFSTKGNMLGSLLATAWPDRIAMRVTPREARLPYVIFQLRTGQTVSLPAQHLLANQAFLVVPGIVWRAQQGSISQACPLAREDVNYLFADAITTIETASVSNAGTVQMLRRTVLDKLVLEEMPLPGASPEVCATTLCDYLRKEGIEGLRRLPWNDATRQWQARIHFLRKIEGNDWPDVSDAALLENIENWLAPFLASPDALKELTAQQLGQALSSLLPWQLGKRLETEAPQAWQSPAGIRHPIVYGDDGGPWLAAKLQEFFGCKDTPRIASGRVPLTLHLNSPAGRPLQITQDLAHFWSNAYAAVRSEMLGRYPRHPWPENPLEAVPTAKTKKQAQRHAT